MIKLKIILFLLLFTSLNCLAQKLTENEKTVFDEIVYKRQKIGEYETLTKWDKPIRYRIYGDTSAYLTKTIDSFFNLLKKITTLDIKKATADDSENFTFVFSSKPEDFQTHTLTKRPLESPGSYRLKVDKKGEIYYGQSLINTKKFASRTNIKNAIRKNIIKCIGFPINSEYAPNSVFTIKNNNDIKIDDFDIHIISALYNPAIKPGMTRDQVDQILNQKN